MITSKIPVLRRFQGKLQGTFRKLKHILGISDGDEVMTLDQRFEISGGS